MEWPVIGLPHSQDAARARAANATARLEVPILASIAATGVMVPEKWLDIATDLPEYHVRIIAPG